jgi:hypothetical protein
MSGKTPDHQAPDRATLKIKPRACLKAPLSYCAVSRRRLAALSSVDSQHQADSLLRLARHHLDTARHGRGL